MNLRLLAIGKITNSKFKLLCDHYLKNINAINKQIGITNVEMIEIQEGPPERILDELLSEINRN